jgi:hypothetical protein
MTRQAADQLYADIVGTLNSQGFTTPPGALRDFQLRGGELTVESHSENAEHFQIVWRPHASVLQPVVIDGMARDAAIDQVRRYAYSAYIIPRRQFEAILNAARDKAPPPIHSRLHADSCLLGAFGLSISEEILGAGREPRFHVEVETTPIPQLVHAGEATPESRRIDVTGWEMGNVRSLLGV